MLGTYAIAYVVLGLISAGVTMAIFPPLGGFRPGLGLRLVATIAFTVLWPLLVGMAVWYLAVGYLHRIETARPQTHLDLRSQPIGRAQATTKPR